MMFILAKYKERPFVVKAKIIKTGINHAKVLSCSIKIFLTAGSNSQAIPYVLPATKIDNIRAKKILFKCFLIYSLYNLFKINFNSSNFIIINLLIKYPKIILTQSNYLI